MENGILEFWNAWKLPIIAALMPDRRVLYFVPPAYGSAMKDCAWDGISVPPFQKSILPTLAVSRPPG